MGRNRVILVVGVSLLVLLVVIGLVTSKKKSTSKAAAPPPSARAVVVPASRARTVVVAPCGAPVASTVNDAKAGKSTPGATSIGLPAGPGVRTLLVPNCVPKTGSTNSAGNLPSAAVVLPGNERRTEGQAGEITVGQISARSKAILPDGSGARTVVVSPCAKATKGTGRDVVLSEEKGTQVAVAPSC